MQAPGVTSWYQTLIQRIGKGCGPRRARSPAETELLLLNQTAIRPALEEVSLWVSQRGSTAVHDNVLEAPRTLDTNADAISSGIEHLRS